MRKSLFVALVCSALVCAFVLPNLSAMEAPGDMVLKAPEGVKARFSPVEFSHDAHSALDCESCHHMLAENPDNYNCMSEGCHDLFNPTSVEEKKDITYFYNAFHDRRSEHSCLGCHMAKKKAGETTGPLACTQCHPK